MSDAAELDFEVEVAAWVIAGYHVYGAESDDLGSTLYFLASDIETVEKWCKKNVMKLWSDMSDGEYQPDGYSVYDTDYVTDGCTLEDGSLMDLTQGGHDGNTRRS